MSLKEFSALAGCLCRRSPGAREDSAKVLGEIGDQLYWDKNFETDLQLYKLALEHTPANMKLRLKYMVLRCGSAGIMAMQAAATVRTAARRLLPKG